MKTESDSPSDAPSVSPWGLGNLTMVHEVTTTPGDHVLAQQGTTTARWDFADRWDDPLGPYLDVGTARWVICDMSNGLTALWDELDAIGADEEAMASVLLRAEDDGEPFDADSVLLVMHAEVPREARGTGLGLIMVQEFVRFASVGRRDPAVLVHPQPDGWQEMQAPQLVSAQESLRTYWRRLKFKPVEVSPSYYTSDASDLLGRDLGPDTEAWLREAWGAG